LPDQQSGNAKGVTPEEQTRRAAVVVNPSKEGDPDALRRDVTDALAAAGWSEPLWLETTASDPGGGQTREALAAGVDVVLVSGGDGTVMSCATELADSGVALAVLPAGTGNLLARNLDLPTDLAEAVSVAVAGGRRRLDVGTLDGRCFTIMAGMGFDADMLADASESVKRRIGWPAYVLSALRHLTDRPMRVRVRLDDGEVMHRRARTVLVANVGRLQGGVPVLPDARPDDGELDVAIIAPRTLREWVVLAWTVLRRSDRPALRETFRARRIAVECDRTQPRELDGEVIEPGRQLNVGVRPGALLLCVPADNAG
jgi:YegS/Rv2252/BmrU family lipid kinase